MVAAALAGAAAVAVAVDSTALAGLDVVVAAAAAVLALEVSLEVTAGFWLSWYAATASWLELAAYKAVPKAVAPATAATFLVVLVVVVGLALALWLKPDAVAGEALAGAAGARCPQNEDEGVSAALGLVVESVGFGVGEVLGLGL